LEHPVSTSKKGKHDTYNALALTVSVCCNTFASRPVQQWGIVCICRKI